MSAILSDIDVNAYVLNDKKYHLKADEEIRTLDPLLGKEMLYH